ncbi:fibrillarin-like rRNA/tRNA 2'-O-methyltransferase [Candidatus Woesearchaeota archaeon]|nr:fibrillarin-like rRNA/tRNA 2'-O-methyltransferase [Candidatus Woesearchaeota archaeon]
MDETKYPGIYENWFGKKKFLFTKSLDGKIFFGEKLIEGYRELDPTRSKLGAAVIKKISSIGLKENNLVLYLGASHGYTASFVSDIVGKRGIVYCVDFSPRVVMQLVFVCEERENMIPILADARKPLSYQNRVTKVDFVYCDVAQREQVDLFLKNVKMFLKPKSYCMLALKARSIDAVKNPRKIYEVVKKELSAELRVLSVVELDPLEKDHCVFLCQYK